MATERAETLRECAILAARSKEAQVSVGYAIAREIWSLWWEEQDAPRNVDTEKAER